MMGKPNIGSGMGTRLRALDEQALVPPDSAYFHYSIIPIFQYSYIPAYNPNKYTQAFCHYQSDFLTQP